MSCRAAALPEALPEALLILVQQECCLREQGVVCRLLATSKSLHSFILAKCIGRVHVALARRKGFRRDSVRLRSSCHAWLAKYGCLMRSLVWGRWFSGQFGKEVAGGWVRDGQEMAELLKAAAATPQGLHLRSFDAAAFGKLPLALQQLPAATLTRLKIAVIGREPDHDLWLTHQIERAQEGTMDVDGSMIYWDDDPETLQEEWAEEMMVVPNHDTEATAAVLKSFTQLQSLELSTKSATQKIFAPRSSPLLQVLPQLTSLTKLTVKELLDAATDLNDRLPPTLQELELIGIHSRHRRGAQPALALGHLTALTRLHTNSYTFDVAAHDVLPPNLHALCVNSVASVKPLLPLTGLRKLAVAILPGVADIAAAITAAGRGASDDKASERAAAPPAGKATPDGGPAGGSFDDRVAQLQLLLPGVAVKQFRRGTEVGCWCLDGDR